MSAGPFRLITRSDFDGLVCAVLLRELGLIDEIKFVHPKDVQDGKVEVTGRDITTNLPFVPTAHLAFDHHLSETIRNDPAGARTNHIINPRAPSAARVVHDHYGGRERFAAISEDLLVAVDQADSARYTLDEVLHPRGWTMLNFIMDPRTGLGRFREFRISNYQLMMELIDAVRTMSVEEVLRLPDVAERINLYQAQAALCRDQLRRVGRVQGQLVVLDMREEEMIHAGNRFLVYALFPECTVSMHVLWGVNRQNTVFAVGKSIFDPSAMLNVGGLMLEYGGGGHEAAGTCQVPHEAAEGVMAALITRIVQQS
jgi:nanoRNase/pAp phosphatase (c-di-AMP/oligoRNAs hydrolase)